jgi:hypothetical protein
MENSGEDNQANWTTVSNDQRNMLCPSGGRPRWRDSQAAYHRDQTLSSGYKHNENSSTMDTLS